MNGNSRLMREISCSILRKVTVCTGIPGTGDTGGKIGRETYHYSVKTPVSVFAASIAGVCCALGFSAVSTAAVRAWPSGVRHFFKLSLSLLRYGSPSLHFFAMLSRLVKVMDCRI